MTLYHAYSLAMRILGEDPEAKDTAPHRSRAAVLLSSVCISLAESDRRYRAELGLPEAETVNGFLTLDDSFPLSARFLPAAACLLASMLTLGENSELSELLRLEGERERDEAISELPATITSTVQRCGARA